VKKECKLTFYGARNAIQNFLKSNFTQIHHTTKQAKQITKRDTK